MAVTQVTVFISGRVQAVGFRFWTRKKAAALGLDCQVENLPDGRVKAVFTGPQKNIKKMITLCHSGPPFAQVKKVEVEE